MVYLSSFTCSEGYVRKDFSQLAWRMLVTKAKALDTITLNLDSQSLFPQDVFPCQEAKL